MARSWFTESIVKQNYLVQYARTDVQQALTRRDEKNTVNDESFFKSTNICETIALDDQLRASTHRRVAEGHGITFSVFVSRTFLPVILCSYAIFVCQACSEKVMERSRPSVHAFKPGNPQTDD
jgi:hypothetical protein